MKNVNYQIPIDFNSIEGLLKNHAGFPVKIEKYQEIKHKYGVSVARLFFRDEEGIVFSAIIKHTTTEETSPTLEHEYIIYQFLMKLNYKFTLFPQLIAYTQGVLIIEDLGNDNSNFEDELTAQKAALYSLAQLHAASFEKSEIFKDIEEDHTKKIPHFNKLPYQGIQENYRTGYLFIKELCDLFGIPAQPLLRQVHDILEIVHNENSPYYSLIHADFISRRQAIVKNNSFYLIDFEHAGFDHCLIDFWQLFIGKIEYNTQTGYYFRKRFEYIDKIEEYYKDRLHKEKNTLIDEKEWQQNLEASLIYTSFSIIGRLINVPKYLKELNLSLDPATKLEEEIRQLLNFLITKIKNDSEFIDLKEISIKCYQKLEKMIDLRNGIFKI